MRTVDPDPQTLERLSAEPAGDTPIVMLNLLRYRDQAAYAEGDDAEPCTGRDAYQRYGALVQPLLAGVGAQPLWIGKSSGTFIAPADEQWDDVILVQYRSRKKFLEMILSSEYGAARHHRTAALEDSRLIETQTLMGPISA